MHRTRKCHVLRQIIPSKCKFICARFSLLRNDNLCMPPSLHFHCALCVSVCWLVCVLLLLYIRQNTHANAHKHAPAPNTVHAQQQNVHHLFTCCLVSECACVRACNTSLCVCVCVCVCCIMALSLSLSLSDFLASFRVLCLYRIVAQNHTTMPTQTGSLFPTLTNTLFGCVCVSQLIKEAHTFQM